MKSGLQRRLGWALAFAFATGVAQGADTLRGRALYEGAQPLVAPTGEVQPPCAQCHRPSGMGSFEGGLAVPPITAPTLFHAYDRDIAHFFRPAQTYRVRPAYDDASLRRLLRTGIAPDGLELHPAMPRYGIRDVDFSDLVSYLRQLASHPPAGIDANVVHIATITTPDVEPVRRDAMLRTLEQFVAQKNGLSRQEDRRAQVSARTGEMATYRKYRRWELHHWALQGDPDTWLGQLQTLQARHPVYAVVGGLGGAEWGPVNRFCELQRVPCLLPLVENAQPSAGDLHSVHFHAGLRADARIAAQALRDMGVSSVAVRGADAGARRVVGEALAEAGLGESGRPGDGPSALVVLGAGRDVLPWIAESGALRPVAWLPGMHAVSAKDLAAITPALRHGIVVTPMQTGDALDHQLARARAWKKAMGLPDESPIEVVASTMLAAGVLGESLTHADFAFNQEYLLELLEHGLENMLRSSPFPRLALGPGQRVGSKGSWVGSFAQGQVQWTWHRSQ